MTGEAWGKLGQLSGFPDDAQLRRLLREAWKAWSDPARLSQSPLVNLLPSYYLALHGGDSGTALQAFLEEILERIRPPKITASPRDWRPYRSVFLRYVEGRSPEEARAQMYISSAEFYRSLQRAWAAMGRVWKEIVYQPEVPPCLESIPRPKNFIGRKEELAYFRRRLEEEHFVAICGMAGVGKSALAAELVHRDWVAPTLWMRFRPELNTNLETVLEGLAREMARLGQKEYWHFLQVDRKKDVPCSPDTYLHYLIYLLETGGYTVCLDDFHLAEHVPEIVALARALWESARQGRLWLVVTSRTPPTFAPGAVFPPLSGLGQDEAREFLVAEGLVDLPEEVFARVYEKTAGTPIFLQFFAAWARAFPCSERGLFVERMEREGEVDEYLMREVLGMVGADAVRILEPVAVLWGPIGADDERLHFLTEGEVKDPREIMARLLRFHLMLPLADGRLALHPLVQEYLTRRLRSQPGRWTKVHRQLAKYYQERREWSEAVYHWREAGEWETCRQVLTEHLPEVLDAGYGQMAADTFTRLLENSQDMRQRFALLAGREQVFDRLGEREKQQTDLETMYGLATLLKDNSLLSVVYSRRARYDGFTGEYRRAVQAARKGLNAARQSGNRQAEMENLIELGKNLRRLGKYRAAMLWGKQALSLAREIGDLQGEATVLNLLGGIYWDREKHTVAEKYWEQALAIERVLGHREHQATLLGNLGAVEYSQKDYLKARERCEQALTIQQAIGDRRGEAATWNNLGLVYCDIGEYGIALEHFERSLAIHRSIGSRWGEAFSLSNLGLVYCEMQEYATALKYFEQSIAIRQDIGDQAGVSHVLVYRGMALEGLGMWEEAAASYLASLSIRQNLGCRSSVIDNLSGLGRIALQRGDLNRAREIAEDILFRIASFGTPGIEFPLKAYLTCAHIWRACGEEENARRALEEGYLLLMKLARRMDETLRRSFLKVPTHRELLREWERLQTAASGSPLPPES